MGHGLCRGHVQALSGEVEICGILATDPGEQRACGLGMLLEQHDRVTVLSLGRLRLVDARQVGLESGEILVPDLGPEGGDAPMRVEREEEIIFALHHRGEDRPDQEIIGIDQDVIRFEAVEGEHELHDHVVGGAKQAMAETKPGVRDGRGNGLRRSQREESAQASLFFDQPQGEAGALGGEKITDEGPIDGQRGSTRMLRIHRMPFVGVAPRGMGGTSLTYSQASSSQEP